MPEYQLGVIGSGNMAEALLRGGIAANILNRNTVLAADPDFGRRQLFTRELGVTATESNAEAAGCRRVLLAVKPQAMGDVLEGIAESVLPDATVVSIVAGIRTGFIADKLGGRGHLVRVMPNTPMLVGAGISALCKGPGADDSDLAWTEKLFDACGQTVRVDESMIDAVTAVSGSGPAYFFYLIEAMVTAGVAEGLEKDAALELAVQTCRGAGQLLIESREAPEVLRAKVSSPGGTTEAAIEFLEAAGVQDTLAAAVRRAAQRSRELGG